MSDKLIIFDTTSRDGEQSPGASMTKGEKIRIAKQLERLEVGVVETGFAASLNGDFEAIRATTLSVKDSHICSLACANDRDISRAAEALKPAGRFHIHTFIATSALHMEKKLRMSPDQVYEQARLAVRSTRQFADDIELSPEDGSRSGMDFLCRILEDVIAEGATTINLPSTVGYAVPEGYAALIHSVRECVPNSDRAVWSVHCRSNLGMAVADSPTTVKLGGARQIECTINGLGERAGDTSLEEVAVAAKTRRDYFNLDVGVDIIQIVSVFKLISQVTGFVVQPNKAVVGTSAFAHASGIHQDGVLKAHDTYEIVRTGNVGQTANEIVLSKLSDRNASKQHLQGLGIELDSETELNAVFTRFKELADQKAEIFDEDIVAIVSNKAQHNEGEHFHFVSLAQHSETGECPHAHVVFVADGKEVTGEAEDNGPVNATLNAIGSKVVGEVRQLLCSVNAITTGTQVQGKVTIRLSKSGRIVNGVGTDPDIAVASAKAYLAALNKLQDKNSEKLNPQI